MKNKFELENRALRCAVAGILNSDLSRDELRQLAGNLDISFVIQLQAILESVTQIEAVNVATQLDNAREDTNLKSRSHQASGLTEIIYEQARQRKLGRQRLYRYIQEINPRLLTAEEADQNPLLELVRKFVQQSSADESRKLLSRVAGIQDEDPYLSGITSRRK